MEELDINRWVEPFYMDFLHGNFAASRYSVKRYSVGRRTWSQWSDLLRRELRAISPEIIGDLMDSDWRPQICGAYFCGLNRWEQFTLDIGRRLVAKQNGNATQGYAFALARMPSHASANYLCGYLSRVGRPQDATDWYSEDLDWVIAALQWVDDRLGTHRLEPYIEKLVPFWQKRRFEDLRERYRRVPSIAERLDEERIQKAEDWLRRTDEEMETYFLPDAGNFKHDWFWNLMAFCEEHFDTTD